MTRSLSKITRREIKNSFGRFLAIFFIVLLGSGFLMGLRTTRPAMLKTLNEYNAGSQFFDFKVMTNYGLTEDDVTSFSQLDGVSEAEGATEMDAIFDAEDNSEIVLKVHALPTTLNKVILRAGRMPQQADECVLDAYHFNSSYIGQTLTLSADNENQDDFTQKTLTVVGLVNSPLYINFTRGTTTLSNGTVAGFIYVQPEFFDVDYFTDIYVRLAKTGDVYTDEYDDAITAATDGVESLAQQRAQLRFDTLKNDAEEEYADGLKEYQDGVKDFNAEKKSVYAKLQKAKNQITTAENTLTQSRKKLDAGLAALQAAQQQLTASQQQYDAQKDSVIAQFDATRQALDEQWVQYNQAVAIYGEAAMAAQKAQLDQAELAYKQQYDAFVAAGQQLAASQLQLDAKKAELKQGESDYADGVAKLNSAKETYRKGLSEANEKFAKAQDDLDDAKAKLEDAREEIDDMEESKSYVLDRYTNSGYASFESDSAIVDGVAKVFPLFFFLVAALVCMTTMNRMVETQRTQIGTLKSLGYHNKEIMKGYLLYSGLASLLGSIVGVAIGSYVFPRIIWQGYNIMYGFTEISGYFDWAMSAVVCAAFLACSLFITWWSCKQELREVPAQLIRPEAPKPGKRILLERIPFIWRHFSFLAKVSTRNIFRYKKRMFMMIVGIAGCMSLLITAFGLNDSITGLGDSQFHDISLYDAQVTFRNPLSQKDREKFLNDSGTTLQDAIFISMSTVDAKVNGQLKSAYLMGTDGSDMTPFMNFALDGQTCTYPKDGEVLINDNLANLLHAKVGDSITLQNADMDEITMTVCGIYHNVVYNYAYTTLNTLHEAGFSTDINTSYVNFTDGVDGDEASAKISSDSLVGAVSLSEKTLDLVNHMLSAMAYIVALIAFCAGALAFIVLYNLTNININERIREIATLKVLGFRRWESAAYVFRENFVLTLMGAVVGIPAGIWLHGFVMGNIKIDMISFEVKILPLSYLYAFGLTILFAVVVDFFMYFRLNRINMAESLKATE